MPIRPENRARYPKDWKTIAQSVKDQAGWRCRQCDLRHGEPNHVTGAPAVMTVAHLDHQPENCTDANLACLCDTCHNRYDLSHRQAGRRERARQQQNQLDLLGGQEPADAT